MNFNEMTIEQLKAYKASVEAYGTDRELYEVEIRINELNGCGVALYRRPFCYKERKGGLYVYQR